MFLDDIYSEISDMLPDDWDIQDFIDEVNNIQGV